MSSSNSCESFESQRHQPIIRLFDYFIICGLEKTEHYSNCNTNSKTFEPNSLNLPFKPIPQYVYNANQIRIDKELDEKQLFEQSEILLQTTRYCYCDLTDLINKHINNCMRQNTNKNNQNNI
eukprot:33023_1